MIKTTNVAAIGALVAATTLASPVAQATHTTKPPASQTLQPALQQNTAGPPKGYVSLSPNRIYDSRDGGSGKIKAGETRVLKIAGQKLLPKDGIAAIIANITVANPAGPGFVTAFPTGQQRPKTSTVNYTKDQVVANGAIVELNSAGEISIYSMTETHVIVDVTGWLPQDSSYRPIQPTRAIDTRETGKTQQAKTSLTLPVLGKYGIPTTGVAAITYNLTAVKPQNPGFLTAYPTGEKRPTTSNVNYTAGQNVANGATTKVGTNGSISIYTMATTDIIVDITGWFPIGGNYTPLTPSRALDTRQTKQRIPAGGQLNVKLSGKHGIPEHGAAGVSYNLTAVDASQDGFVTAHPAKQLTPTASNINYRRNTNVANNVVSTLSADGHLTLYSMSETDVIIDITGWYAGQPFWLWELNRIRAKVGRAPVVENPKLSHECTFHTRYMAKYGLKGHLENEAHPESTPEGRKCAKESNLRGFPFGVESYLDESRRPGDYDNDRECMATWQASTMGHYEHMIRRNLYQVGFARLGPYCALNVIAGSNWSHPD